MMKANDAISGKEGTVFATVGRRRYEMAEVKSIDARLAINATDVQAIGMRMTKRKAVGTSGLGDITVHYFSSVVRLALHDFYKTGIFPDITIKISNADITSSKGRHTVLLKEVMFDETVLAALDGTSDDTLEDSTSFSFGDYEILETFK